MEAVHIQKFVHSAPRKLRLVADMIRKLEPNKALALLKFTNKKAALDLAKAIKTAISNAKQKGWENVFFKSVEINEGPVMKRFKAASRGRSLPYKKKMSHIKIVISDEKEGK